MFEGPSLRTRFFAFVGLPPTAPFSICRSALAVLAGPRIVPSLTRAEPGGANWMNISALDDYQLTGYWVCLKFETGKDGARRLAGRKMSRANTALNLFRLRR